MRSSRDLREPHAQPFELAAQRLEVRRPLHRDRVVEPAVADVADGLVDLADRPRQEHREQHDQADRDRHQRRGLPVQPAADVLGLGLQLLQFAVRLRAGELRELPGVARQLRESRAACADLRGASWNRSPR